MKHSVKHSPGPWVHEARNHSISIADTGDERCHHITDAEGGRVVEIWGDADRDEANARLIASAPDMRALLEELHDEHRLGGVPSSHSVWDRIAKLLSQWPPLPE